MDLIQLKSVFTLEFLWSSILFPSGAPPPPSGVPVLISGASFAGLATAYWLTRLGYRGHGDRGCSRTS